MDYLTFQSLRHSEELYHHRIEGQKWGVRRFQNDGGSLTPAGRERYYGNGTGGNGIQRQRARSVRKMERKTSKIQSEIDAINNPKNAFSVKAAGHRVLSSVYKLNENTYKKSNKTLSSMNAAAKTRHQNLADKAQEEANKRREDRLADKNSERLAQLNKQQQRVELTNEYRQKVLDVKASKTAGGRFVNHLLGGFGGNLAVSSMELKGDSRGTALGKEYVAGVLGNLTGIGPAVNAYIYMTNRDQYINAKMNKK